MPVAVNMSLVFAGRQKELATLNSLYVQRKHVLLIGPPGIGKSALLQQVRHHSPLLFCEETSKLSRICDGLERQLGWAHYKLNLIERKNRLLNYIERRGEPIAFDHVAQTPPRIARFMAHLKQHVPIWIVCRSEVPHDIGRIWEYLSDFVRIHVPALTMADTRLLVTQAVNRGTIQKDAITQSALLHRLSKGNPRILEELLIELSIRKYKMGTSFGRCLLDLDRRIQEITTNVTGPLSNL